MKLKSSNFWFNIALLITGSSFLITLIGCDAFVRKFSRKPKRDNLPKEEMVLVPEEYKPAMDKEELYRQYMLFWQSWQDELIESLTEKKSNKKQISCAEEAIKNLLGLRGLLDEARKKKLDVYIAQMVELQALIAKDVYGSNSLENVRSAEIIKRAVLRDFSFHKIKKYLI